MWLTLLIIVVVLSVPHKLGRTDSKILRSLGQVLDKSQKGNGTNLVVRSYTLAFTVAMLPIIRLIPKPSIGSLTLIQSVLF